MINAMPAPSSRRSATRPKTTSQERRRQALIATLASQVEEYAHGYCTVPTLSNPNERHTVHVNKNYEPDYCTCDNHVEWHGDHCAHKDAVRLHFAGRLETASKVLYSYHDENAKLRGVFFPEIACRFDQLSLAEQERIYRMQASRRAADVVAFDPCWINSL